VALVPAVSPEPAVTVAMPFVKPLYDTRAVERTLADLARKMSVDYKAATVRDLLPPDAPFEEIAREGCSAGDLVAGPTTTAPAGPPPDPPAPASFAGDPAQYPLLFQPYLSLQFHDGAGANLPWLQELPDPASSSIWGLPVEIDPQLAAQLHIANGDVVRVESLHGAFEAPAYVHPGAIPGVVSMPIGDGHASYGRYASGRGANPLSILAPVWEKSTGALALGGTRVRLARAGPRRGWIQFAPLDRGERGEVHR
jgi:molybdopterin-containing oxidoreductase family iron-sulfur binding subunit